MQAQSRLTVQAHGDGIVPPAGRQPDADPPWLGYEYVEGSDLSGLMRNWADLRGRNSRSGATAVIRRLAGWSASSTACRSRSSTAT